MLLSLHKSLFTGRLLSLPFLLCMSLACLSQEIKKNKKTKQASANSDSSQKTIAADPGLKPTTIRKIFIGKNYRAEWIEPITVPVLNLTAAQMKPTKEGGGKQTRS